MARIAALTFRISTDTRIDAKYMADFRIGGRQMVRRGGVEEMAGFLANVKKSAPASVTVEVKDETGELSHLLLS